MSINKVRLLNVLKLGTLLIIWILFICSSMPIFAAADTKVYDYANLFSLEQLENLEASARTLAETYKMDIGIVTIDDAEGKSAMDYADDFYDSNGYGYGNHLDGLLFLIDMDNRELYISTCGLGIQYFTDLRINKMLDSIYTYMSKQDYYGASTNFLNLTEQTIKKGVPSNQRAVEKEFSDPRIDYNDYNMSDAPSKHIPFRTASGKPLNPSSITLSMLAAALGAAIIAFVTRYIVQYRYKNPRYTAPQTKPDSLSVNYTERQDAFVSTHTSRIKIPKNDNNGSGGGGSGISSIHSSSSGQSHGGGGRSF